ncbi:ATP-dependent DNA helicase [Caenorhabditis elegans]|uniref:ATP-dependent DNA helicase n=1 Tax=Caenorhabditis elegans TaxID=6239 RepID=Q9U3T4_CAEEL|nr:ATP-dependent DNA helicase [Caenorhabditis elegans]CAB60760.2 ATP-dependent DNA helicase [Caenorhabditis elegans]|eukprot:NP_507820.2 ATP-dependent DNA helicase [Caenorhabditis elegans]
MEGSSSVGKTEITILTHGNLHTMANDEQQQLLNKIVRDDSQDKQVLLMINGAAGTGKTFLIKLIENSMNRSVRKRVVLMTGSTGKAAKAIGGRTLHCTIGLPNEKPEDLERLKYQAFICVTTRLIIIDEITLLASWHLDATDMVLKRTPKRTDALFGGLSIILVGDLRQLNLGGWRGKKQIDTVFIKVGGYPDPISCQNVCD